MKYKILFWIFTLILSTSFVSAVSFTKEDVILWYDGSNSSGGADNVNNLGTLDGVFIDNAAQTPDGKIGDGFDLDGSNDFVNSTWLPEGNWSIIMWVNLSSTNLDFDFFWSAKATTSSDGASVANTAELDSFILKIDTSSGSGTPAWGNNIPAGTYHMITVTYDGTRGEFYQNNISINGLTDTIASYGNFLMIGEEFKGSTNNREMDGQFDEFVVLNITINLSQVNEFYNNGIGITHSDAFPPLGISINVSLTSPTNDTTSNNQTQEFKYIPIALNSELENCSLWSNFTGTWQLNQTNTSALINGTNNTIEISNIPNGNFIWNVECFNNATNSSFADNNFTLTIDTISPIITDNFINNTALFRNNLTGQFNFTDNNLLNSVNFTLPRDGNISIFNQTNISANTFQHNISYNISGLTSGNKILRIRFADAGTDKKLGGDYKFKKGLFNNYIKYEFWDRGYLKTNKQDSSIFDKWTSIKEIDKYIQIYEPYNKKETQVFIEESEQPIYIYKNENKNHHGGTWIVTGNHWKDYVLKDEPQAKVKIKRIDKYKVEVTISNIINKEKLQFESVGDLNVVTKDYNFSIANVSESFTTPSLNDLETNLFLDFNNAGHPAPTTVILQWNNTNFTATQTINNATLARYKQNITPSLDLNTTNKEVNISHKWFFNLTTEEETTIQNQTIQQISLDNCSDLTTVALNYSIKDEANQTLLDTADVTGTYNYNNGGGSGRTFDLTVTNRNNFSICIFPPSVTLTGNYTLTYSADNYQQRNFIDNNPTITNTTQDIDLFLLNDADGIFGIFRTINTIGQTISGALITMIKVIGGSPETVETQLTDDSGLATFFVDPDVTYSFVFTKTGFQTQTFNLRITTSEVITVTLISTEDALDQPEGIGILFFFTPINEVPLNNTDTNFTFNLTSSFRDITSCNFTLKNSTADLATIEGTFTTGACTASISLNTGNQTLITAEAQYSLNITINRTISQDYIILNTYVGQFSLKNFFDDLDSFGDAGFNDTTRIILALVVIITITSITANKIPIIRDPEPLIILAWALSFIFASIGWLTINSTTMPNIAGFDLQQWFLFILITVVTLSYIIKREFF